MVRDADVPKDGIPDTIPRAALIVGARPYGIAIARALATAGFAVAIQCDPATTERSATPPSTTMLPLDAADPSLFSQAAAALGPIGVLVNGAPSAGQDTWDAATRTIWDTQFETTLRLPFMLIQQFAKALPESREGVAINLLDQRVGPGAISYSLANAALATLTQTLALALAPAIRVNSIAIGSTLRSRDETGVAEPKNVAGAVMAILALRSMTGQMMVPGVTSS